MKLSTLVSYRNHLRNLHTRPAVIDALRDLGNVEHFVASHEVQIDNRSKELHDNLQDIETRINNFHRTLEHLGDQVDNAIRKQEPDYYRESLCRYEEEMCFETTEYILNRRLAADPETLDQLETNLRNYTDWRLPGLIIRPGRDNFIEHMVPLDPLYLVDHDMDLLTPSIKNFTPEYQQRLRPYVVKETPAQPFLNELPTNQFGLIFAYNFFNFKPIEIIQRYLEEGLTKLRPGGVFMFTFNDCDFETGVGSAEHAFQCYTPGSAIKNIADNLGYEFVYEYKKNLPVSWLEFKKPGIIKTNRGGQSLSKVLAKPT